MNTFDSEMADRRSRTLNTILREDYGWVDGDFIDGMAPLESHWGTKIWNPKTNSSMLTKFMKHLFCIRHRRAVELCTVINRAKLLKFARPDIGESVESFDWRDFYANRISATPKNDLLNWAGFFMREAKFSIDFEEYDKDEHTNWLAHQSLSVGRKINKSDLDNILRLGLFDQWMRFRDDELSGFDFTVRFTNAPFIARIPSIVLYGVEWISICSVNDI